MALKSVLSGVVLFAITGSPASAQSQDEFFDDTVLHELRIHIAPRDWEALKTNYLENTYYPVEFQWRGVFLEPVGVRNRGLSSRSAIKPQFNVDFNRFEEKQLFLGMTTFKLDNNVTDASMTGERLTMLLFKRMGLPYLREVHANLYVNDKYAGVYTIVENPNKNFLRRTFNDDDGYLYQYEWVAPYRFEWKGDGMDNYFPAPFQPQTHENNPNPEPLRDMIRTINQASDTEFVSAVGEFVDWDNFLGYLAIESYLSEADGLLGDNGLANFWIYNLKGSKRFTFIPWDKDSAFGPYDHPITKNGNDNVLVRRVLANPQLRARYLNNVLRVAALTGGEGGWMAQEVERVYRQIGDAVRADSGRPCTTDVNAPCALETANAQFETNIDYDRAFLRLRPDVVMEQLAALGYQPPDNAPAIAPGGVTHVDGASTPIAAASNIVIAGQNFGSAAAESPNGLSPGTSVWVNGYPAVLDSVSPDRIGAKLPVEAGVGTMRISVIVDGWVSSPAEITVTK